MLDPERIRLYTAHNRRPRRSGQCYRIVGVSFCLIVVVLLQNSCQPVPATPIQPVDATPSPIATKAPDHVRPSELPPTSPTSIPTHAPISCLLQSGTMEVHEIRRPDLVSPIRFRVYLPPCYKQDTFATYPTLILLHGLQATDQQWEDLGIHDVADQLIHAGEAPPFIILMPWIRSHQDPLDAVIDAVIPFAQEQWRLSDKRGFWAIGGISRGGGQALQIGLLHPARFNAIGLHSPAILHNPDYLLGLYLKIEETQRPAIWLDIGESDSLVESAMQFVAGFKAAEARITTQLNPGDHTSDYWRAHVRAYLNWYASFWYSPMDSE